MLTWHYILKTWAQRNPTMVPVLACYESRKAAEGDRTLMVCPVCHGEKSFPAMHIEGRREQWSRCKGKGVVSAICEICKAMLLSDGLTCVNRCVQPYFETG